MNRRRRHGQKRRARFRKLVKEARADSLQPTALTIKVVLPETATRILDATYLVVHPVCPDCGHVFRDATLAEIEAHILDAHRVDVPEGRDG